MSMNSEPVALDLEALPEDPGYDDVALGDDEDPEAQGELSHRDYDALEEAVMQTARGRTFLREHARRNRAVASDLVMRALDDCRTYFQRHEMKQPTDILAAELQDMSDAIKHTRRDIAAIKPKDGANNRIMAATEDLDAIVTATERATNDILAAAERIQDACETMREGGSNDELLDTLEEDITNIFLACSFQDITGQRTTKVVNALHYLEQRVGAMIEIWGSESLRNGAEDDFSSVMLNEEHPEAGLLNGPQLEGQGVDQADIDQLMNGGDGQSFDEVEPSDDSDANGADPTDGIEFDAVPAAAAQTVADEPIVEELVVAELVIEEPVVEEPVVEEPIIEEPVVAEIAAEPDAADDMEIEEDFSGLSEEADADTIDAIFNS
ncbi:MAG: hypothetical protein HN478_10950 [Rhodospirillaceae bacterium]|jgi:chemotaxis protein CheZ|nr:hypothetical protein [Rhodospirillaceae bacterium]MBT4489345.1 hypothetical protein [Rhodospirillaceae bacterium]MBT4689818.1 hypothetical protein [Rhodospirillaceae bacterium]MBT5191483.1 hypothetical protein [Rhodospirillaceae bacterium]MBT5899188.1 hypothetical protein [Rhodospirillaceae bacterium]